MAWWFVVLFGQLAQRRNCLFRVISLFYAWSTFNKELLILSNAPCLLLVLGRLQRRSGWRDLEYGPRELWQPQVCSYCNFITLHCQDMFFNKSVLLQASSWADFSLQVAAWWGACRIYRSGFKAWPYLLCKTGTFSLFVCVCVNGSSHNMKIFTFLGIVWCVFLMLKLKLVFLFKSLLCVSQSVLDLRLQNTSGFYLNVACH